MGPLQVDGAAVLGVAYPVIGEVEDLRAGDMLAYVTTRGDVLVRSVLVDVVPEVGCF